MKDLTIDIGEWRLNCRATAIIIHDNKILLHHNVKEPYYALVGGRIKIGENSADTVKREFKEETGKDIELTGYIATIENFFEANNKKYHEITFVHKAEFVDEKDKKTLETIKNIEGDTEKNVEYEWIDLNNIDKTPIRPEVLKKILTKKVYPTHEINNDLRPCKFFEYVFNDKKIRSIYNQIDENENNNDKIWAHHNWDHVVNVMNITNKILTDLNYDKDTIESAKLAAILHDIGAIDGKENHAYKSYKFAEQYFDENNIKFAKRDMVLEAIKNHSDGFDSDNVIQLVLILADKIELKSTRPTQKGLEVIGMRQTQYINNIDFKIENGELTIKFETDNKIDKKELEEYYFMKKVGNAIKSFASKLNLKYNVLFNENKWTEIL